MVLKSNIEYRKGILFIRLNGCLDKSNLNTLIETKEFKYIVFNIDKLYAIDDAGINYLLKINRRIKKNNGKLLICDKNSPKKKIFNEIPKINNELEAFYLCKEMI